jgi:hypothetical protein
MRVCSHKLTARAKTKKYKCVIRFKVGFQNNAVFGVQKERDKGMY